MDPLILQRLISAAVSIFLILTMAWFARRGDRALVRRATFACDCGYGVEGLSRPRCPECGVQIDGRNTLRQRVVRFRNTARWMAFFEIVFAGILCRDLFVEILGAYRVLKIGPFAFLPGYSLFDDINSTDLVLGGLVIALWLAVVFERTRAVRRTVESYEARLRPTAEAFDQRIKFAEAGVS